MASGPNVSQRYKEQMWLGIFFLPFGLEWAYLWIVALPYTWTLLPWGDFAYNWWKIFPYFGLGIMSIGGLIGPLAMIFGPDPEPVHELGSRYLQKGMKGSDVREVQQLLNEHGISCGVDGNFGPQTEDAVKQFQTGVGFGMKVDGVVGKKTLAALRMTPEKPEISVSVYPPVPIHHQPITVSFAGNIGDNHSWIGIYLPDAPNSEHGERWLYVCGAKIPSEVVEEGEVTFSEGLAPGDYEVRLFGDNGLERLLISQTFTVSDQESKSKPEVRMRDAIIHGNHLHGTAIDHPKLGTTEIKTSSILDQDKEGEVHRIETENTIYLIHKNDWTDDVFEEETPVVEASVKEIPTVEVKAEQQAAERIQSRARDLKGMAQELQNVTFSSDREKIVKGTADQPQSLDLIIEKIDRTTAGFRLREELKGGLTVFGRTADGAEIEMRMPSSMNEEINRLGKGDTLTCKASVAGWNTLRKLLQMDWME